MMAANIDEKAVFNGARRISDAAAREAYLQSACGDDAEALQRIGELLRVYEQAQSFLEAPAGAAYSPTISDAPITESPGTVIGPYRLLEQIGEGGFGVVFMAEQTAPVKRRVALKVIKPGMDTREVIARFEAERQALALMDHPNIAKVFDAGTTGKGQGSRVKGHESRDPQPSTLGRADRPFFVMELVRGVPITDYCDQHQLTPKERLELFVTVCQAVQHAHQKGIIHRDIKPTNVLVTQHDDRPVVKVIDFGIAKAISGQLTDKTLFTGFAQLVGTPLYMSPEQAALNGIDVDTRSDIYSLGVLLYELLTGTTPFDKARLEHAAFDDIRRIIREEEPPRPSARISTVRSAGTTASALHRSAKRNQPSPVFASELDWIAMKALEKDRNRRYESASALERDVERHLRDEPVQACPPSGWYRFRKFARRNKSVLATATIVCLAVLLAVAALATSTMRIAREQQLTADALRNETQAKEDLARTLERERQDSYFHRIALVHRELSADNLGRALELLDECPNDLRGWEWRYLRRLCQVEPLVLRGDTEFTGIAFSPDGRRLAAAGRDGTVTVWNSQTDQVLLTLNAHDDSLVGVAFHPDGRHLVSASLDGQAKVWDLTTSREVHCVACDAANIFGAAYTVAFSPDGRYLAAGSDGAVRIWDWRKRQCLFTFPGHESYAINVAFSRDGRRLASGSWGGSVRLWDVEAGGEPLCTFAASRDARHPACALAFDHDGRRLASASFGRRVDLWDTMSGSLLHTLPHSGLVLGVAVSPDGRRLASVGEDKTVRVWDTATGREVLGLRGHTSVVGCVAFSPDGHRLASASLDGTIRVWDGTPLAGGEGQETLTFSGHDNEIWSLAVAPDGRNVASGGFSTPIKVWDEQTGQVSVDFTGHGDVVFCVAWQPDGRRLASAGSDDWSFTVKVCDAQTGRQLFALPPGREYFAAVFSPDSQYLITAGASRTVEVWDAQTGAPVSRLGVHAREIRGVAISRDGRHVASASGDGMVKLWDGTHLTEEQEPRLTLAGRVPGPCLNVAFSPDGRRLATAGDENTVRIWDVETGSELQTLRGHTGDVYSVAFSPDDEGRWIASAGEDSTVKVWDSYDGGRPVRSFRGHVGLVSSVAFTPDGLRLVSGSRDHTVKVWDLTDVTRSEKGTRR